jgi:hypothetical protein
LTVSGHHGNSCFRTIPLDNVAEFQECLLIDIGDVPEMPDTAQVGRVTPRSVRYDAGRESWFVDPADKGIIRAYRKQRSAEDIEAGAFPNISQYFDEGGPL